MELSSVEHVWLLQIINSTLLFLIALITAYTAHIARRTEVNTNSMKDALVASTKVTSHAEGLAEGRAEPKK